MQSGAQAKIENFIQQLNVFNDIYLFLLSDIESLRKEASEGQGFLDKVIAKFSLSQSSDVNASTSLLSAPGGKTKRQLAQEKLDLVTSWFSADVEDALKAIATAQKQLITAYNEELTARRTVGSLFQNRAKEIKNKLEKNCAAFEAAKKEDRGQREEKLNALASFNREYLPLRESVNKFGELNQSLEEFIKKFNEKYEPLRKNDSDFLRDLVELMNSIPSLAKIKETPTQKIKFAELENEIINVFGSEWGSIWNRDLPLPMEISGFSKSWLLLEEELEEKKQLFEQQCKEYTPESWNMLLEKYEDLRKRVSEKSQSDFNFDFFKGELLKWIGALTGERILSEDEQAEVYANLEGTFARATTNLSEQVKLEEELIEEITKLIDRIPVIDSTSDIDSNNPLIKTLDDLWGRHSNYINFLERGLGETVEKFRRKDLQDLLRIFSHITTSNFSKSLHTACKLQYGRRIKPGEAEQLLEKASAQLKELYKKIHNKMSAFEGMVNGVEELRTELNSYSGFATADEIKKEFSGQLPNLQLAWAIDIQGEISRQQGELSKKAKEALENLNDIIKSEESDKVKEEIYKRQAMLRVDEIKRALLTIKEKSTRLGSCLKGDLSHADKYREQYEALCLQAEVIIQILSGDDDPLLLSQFVSEVDENLDLLCDAHVRFVSHEYKVGLRKLEQEAKEVDADYESFDLKNLKELPNLLQVWEEQQVKLSEAEKKKNEYQMGLEACLRRADEPLVSRADALSLRSAYNWAEQQLSAFLGNVDGYFSEKVRRDRLLEEAKNWLPRVKEQFQLLEAAKKKWEAVNKSAEDAKRTRQIFQRATEMRLKLLEFKRFLIAGKGRDQEIKSFVEELKKEVSSVLTALQRENIYSCEYINYKLMQLIKKAAEDFRAIQKKQVEEDERQNKSINAEKQLEGVAECLELLNVLLIKELLAFSSPPPHRIFVERLVPGLAGLMEFMGSKDHYIHTHINLINANVKEAKEKIEKIAAHPLISDEISALRGDLANNQVLLAKKAKTLSLRAVEVNELMNSIHEKINKDAVKFTDSIADVKLSEEAEEILKRVCAREVSQQSLDLFPGYQFAFNEFKVRLASAIIEKKEDLIAIIKEQADGFALGLGLIEKTKSQNNTIIQLETEVEKEEAFLREEKDRFEGIQRTKIETLTQYARSLLNFNSEDLPKAVGDIKDICERVNKEVQAAQEQKEQLMKEKTELAGSLESFAKSSQQLFVVLKTVARQVQDEWEAMPPVNKFLQPVTSLEEQLKRVLSNLYSNFQAIYKSYNGKYIAEATQLFNMLSLMNNEAFLQLISYSLTTQIVKHWESERRALWVVYQQKMRGIEAGYQQLLSVNAQVSGLQAIEVELDDKKLARLNGWVEDALNPFLEECRRFVERETHIATLEGAIEKCKKDKQTIASIKEQQDQLNAMAAQIDANAKQVKELEALVVKRVDARDEFEKKYAEFKEQKTRLSDLSSVNFSEITGTVFLRFKHHFYVKAKNKLNELKGRAENNTKETNKQATLAFIERLDHCETNLAEFLALIQTPLQNKSLPNGENPVSLTSSRGKPTKTCELIQQLDEVIQALIAKRDKLLFLDDVEADYKARKKLFKNADFLYDETKTDEQPTDSLFTYHYEELNHRLSGVETKHNDEVETLQAALQMIKSTGGSEKDRLVLLKDALDTALSTRDRLRPLDQLVAFSPTFFQPLQATLQFANESLRKGSRLEALLKEYSDILGQVLASYPEVKPAL